ncbi:branched-chain amino acid ABC transporter permease [Hydrogenophaga sp. OTU3427]|uniref:branched-chain amino acid ABC transporter permease n=1 Tax=Hydrogenophaga sp. OTU3427 TaxID=3043856 RepID=UPI00313C3EA2
MKHLRYPAQWLPLLVLLGLALVPTLASLTDDNFLVTFFARVLIYGIAASALNIALGFGGLVSLGHALFIGIGMYSVALPVHFGVTSGWVHLAWCIGMCATVGVVTGLVSLRTTGIGFIMITLAFAQMGYFVIISLKQFGGDDGLSINGASDFFGLRLSGPVPVYYAALLLLGGLLLWSGRMRQSPFGMALRGARQNARRVASIGLALRHYQLAAYVLSAVVCGLAGLLFANLNAYASPSTMAWTVSGELIVMVVLGGMGTVTGPLLGAVVFLGIEEVFKLMTEHWMAPFGLAILAVSLVGKSGLMGWLAHFTPRAGTVREEATP